MHKRQELFVLLKTDQKKVEGYTKKQVKNAILVKKTQSMIAHPTDEKFKQMSSSKCLKNCRVTVADTTNVKAMFVPKQSGLRGEIVGHRPNRVEAEYVQARKDFYVLHKFVTLTVDVMFLYETFFLLLPNKISGYLLPNMSHLGQPKS